MLTDNKGILACAGAGKTFTICHSALSSTSSSLMITYTNKGKENINKQIENLNGGISSNKVKVETWFDFLLNEIIRPYQTVFLRKNLKKQVAQINFFQSIDFSTTHLRNYHKKTDFRYYYAGDHKLRHNETVVLADELISLEKNKILKRLYQQYKTIYIDEVQDLVGTDIDLIMKLIDSPIRIVMVGDPKQYTFSTHSERKNTKYSGVNIGSFFKRMEKLNKLTKEYKQVTRRFGPELAQLANAIDPSGEQLIGSSKVSREKHTGIFLITKDQISDYCNEFKAEILVNNKTVMKRLPSELNYINFGNSKGMTFNDIVIVPTKPFEEFLKNKKALDSPVKYYIAATRARYSIAILVTNPEQYQMSHPTWKIWNKKLII